MCFGQDMQTLLRQRLDMHILFPYMQIGPLADYTFGIDKEEKGILGIKLDYV
jgi:hypothetical protein